MNRIYRRIWNAVRQCWVVASELSSPRGKPAQTRVLMSALLLTTAGGAFAANETDDLDLATESSSGTLLIQKELIPVMSFAAPNSVASAIAPRGRYDQWAIVMSGNYADARVSGADVLALGSRAQIYGTESTGLGNYAETSGGYATAVGHFARAFGGHGTALGTKAYASGKGATALGHDSQASAGNAVSIGSGARASYSDSVAIGANSVTYGSNTVSVGSSGGERRITNVREGSNGTDAVNLNQLANTNRNVATTYDMASTAKSTAASAQTTANTAQNTANTARSNADSALSKANTLSALLSQTASYSDIRIGAGNSGSLLDIRNSGGYTRRIYGVSEGTISSNSTDAVNGAQLNRVQNAASDARTVANSAQTSANAAQTTANTAKSNADSALSKANTLSTLLSQTASNGDVRIGAGNSGSLLDVRNSGGYSRKVTGVAEGAVGSNSTDAVNGTQLNRVQNTASDARTVANSAQSSANTAQTTANAAKSNADSALSKANTLSTLLSQTASNGNVRIGGGNSGTILDVRNSGNSNRLITGVAKGKVDSTSSDAVNGQQLFATDEIARGAGTLAQGAVAAANNAVAKVTVLEGLVREDGPAGSVRLGGNNAGSVLDVRNKSDGKRKITGVAEGSLVAGSADAVTGGQLATTNANVAGAEKSIADVVARVEAASRHIAVGRPIDDEKAQAGRLGVAIGDSAYAAPAKDGAVALGSYSRAEAEDSVSLGRAAWVQESASRGFALGSRSVVEEAGGLALGANSSVKKGAQNAVAIGYGSTALESNTASFGDGALQRRLTNIARGTADHNATTVGQLNDSLATLGGGAKLDANGNVTAPTYRVQNTDQRTVGGALAILDGAVLRTTSRVDGMEGQLRSIFQDTATARADGFNQLTLAGAQGMIISNVANGLIAAGSREAVNGGQLHAVQQQLNGRIDGLEQRVDGQGPAPQSRAMALASTEQEAAVPTPPATQDDKVVADTGNAPKSSPAPQPKADAPESPKPQVDTAELEKMLARANDYSDGIAREVDARLNKMDKRFNRMAAMSSAQTAMAMNTAGLATYNRLGAGVGYAEGESAMAVGYQRVLNDKGSATFSLNGAFTNSGERSVGVGVGIGW
ncbi:ESPR-type extended signal peptide-containing protein [Stenotrophomonas forensis]|uniref:YadA-like family protein n=2 Tax=Bacteria TaxID=2 RepID=A0ABY7XZ53_9GAMM|nr:ESPR-type extended signal peptide-containing protein [Stenotrophomonas sp. DFS-20110405]WDM62979.1 YadA-like family protein [Stenotrophomonas sp. DFS-20110405]